MRYTIGILITVVVTVVVVVLGVGSFLLWRYEDELNKTRAEAEQLKAEGDKMKAERAVVKADLDHARELNEAHKANINFEVARLQAELGRIPEGEVFHRPALEEVPELKGMAGSLGFHTIHVYRWRGGTLEGWVQFQTEAEPVKQDLEVAKHVEHLLKNFYGDGKVPPYDPRGVHGVIMIALKERKDKSSISDCLVKIQFMAEHLSGKGGSGTGYSFSGAIDARKSDTSFNYPFGPSVGSYGDGKGARVGGLFRKFEFVPVPELPIEKQYQLYNLKVSTAGGK